MPIEFQVDYAGAIAVIGACMWTALYVWGKYLDAKDASEDEGE